MRRQTWWFGIALVAAGAAGVLSGGREPSQDMPSEDGTSHTPGIATARMEFAVKDAWLESTASAPKATIDAAPPTPLPKGSFGRTADLLRERARAGDAAAARALYEGLQRCATYTPLLEGETVEERAEIVTAQGIDTVRSNVETLRESLRKRGEDASRVRDPTIASLYEVNLDRQRARSAECEGAGMIGHDDAFEAHGLASDLDDPDMRVSYWLQAFDRRAPLAGMRSQRERGLAGLRRALAAGDWRALAAIGEIHETGWLALPSPELAYAYTYAASLGARGAGLSPLPWHGRGGDAADVILRERLDHLGASLGPAAREAARAYGETRHAACCAGAP
ncbi:hypothetical protein ACQQ2N_20555 [Dokdonella sp. MW10]|uniref:hypothetical protein n=1 Tax=Dokdonella sp. MW10 TaxID=2992926 RepID=UPI003F816F96